MSRINSALKLLVAVSAASLLLGGCLSSNVDLHWGEAHETTNLAEQIANPDASQIERPGPGNLDPGTAERTAETYYEIPKKSFGGKKSGPTIEIGEGGQMQM
jgi:hypothetical protein